MITGIHHINLLIGSEECLEFYKALGFEENYRKARANDTVVLLEGYNMQLEVFIDVRHPARVTDITEPLGPRHFAFYVDSIEEEIRKLTSALKSKGLMVKCNEPSYDWTGERYCFIEDLDGNIIELHE